MGNKPVYMWITFVHKCELWWKKRPDLVEETRSGLG